jgi:hypothetical protein
MSGSAGGFQVTMSALLATAGKFRAAGRDFAAAMPARGPAPVNGGSWVINDALSQVLGSVGLVHTGLADIIDADAAGLEATYREYRRAEDQIVTVVSGVVVDPAKEMSKAR